MFNRNGAAGTGSRNGRETRGTSQSKRKSRRLAILSSAIAGLAALFQGAQASTTWDGGGGATTNINTNTNWSDDVTPTLTGRTSTLTFGTGGSTATINTAVDVLGIVIDRNANFTIADGAGSLTLGTGGITVTLPNTTARTHTISESSLVLAANQTWSITNNTGAAALNVSSAISGAGTLTKTGSGTLTLSGNSSTYTGATMVTAGTLIAGTVDNQKGISGSTTLFLGDTTGSANATIQLGTVKT